MFKSLSFELHKIHNPLLFLQKLAALMSLMMESVVKGWSLDVEWEKEIVTLMITALAI